MIENHACATRSHEVTISLYACVRMPRRTIYEAKFLIAEYIGTKDEWYKTGITKMDAMQADIRIIKSVVTEHGEK